MSECGRTQLSPCVSDTRTITVYAASRAARAWSAADEPALPNSFSNSAAGDYSQSELAPAIGLAGDASPVRSTRFSTGRGGDRLVSTADVDGVCTGRGGDRLISTADVDGVPQSAPAGGPLLWMAEQFLGPDGSIVPAEDQRYQQWIEQLGPDGSIISAEKQEQQESKPQESNNKSQESSNKSQAAIVELGAGHPRPALAADAKKTSEVCAIGWCKHGF